MADTPPPFDRTSLMDGPLQFVGMNCNPVHYNYIATMTTHDTLSELNLQRILPGLDTLWRIEVNNSPENKKTSQYPE